MSKQSPKGDLKFFKPEDFVDASGKPAIRMGIADIANAKLLESGVEVYGKDNKDWMVYTSPDQKYKALLINITEVKQETCADVLEALLKIVPRPHSEYSAIVDRAKAALDRERES